MLNPITYSEKVVSDFLRFAADPVQKDPFGDAVEPAARREKKRR